MHERVGAPRACASMFTPSTTGISSHIRPSSVLARAGHVCETAGVRVRTRFCTCMRVHACARAHLLVRASFTPSPCFCARLRFL
eukprot:4675817-Pleurochrysis_carterae.AAC.1